MVGLDSSNIQLKGEKKWENKQSLITLDKGKNIFLFESLVHKVLQA
jgi:hypothetical protein